MLQLETVVAGSNPYTPDAGARQPDMRFSDPLCAFDSCLLVARRVENSLVVDSAVDGIALHYSDCVGFAVGRLGLYYTELESVQLWSVCGDVGKSNIFQR